MTNIIILPGIGGSDSTHWQSHWKKKHPQIRRFKPRSWDHPDLADWTNALEVAVGASEEPPLLVAHSLACLLVAHWQAASSLSVAGAFLVAVPDPASASFPREAAEFGGSPAGRLRFPTIIVASTNDPYGTVDYARAKAVEWGSRLVEVGAVGHINGQSGLEEWPSGFDLFMAFCAGIGLPV